MNASDAFDTAGEADAVGDLTDREVRGLTEYLVVLPTDAPGLFTVYSEDGTPRTVDVEDPSACDCPDREYNDPEGPCKHNAAAAFLTGAREIPAWVDEESIKAQLAGDAGEGR